MELLEGRTLQAQLAERRRLPAEQAIDIARQICAGLNFAHAKGVIHRDVKPGNVILASTGFVKITDFGIARMGEGMTLTGQVLGTPHYMSPEQVLGKPSDARSDLFSVAVMLYEMLTGERPFDGQSVTTVMYKIVHETPVPPRALDSAIHPGLSAVIEKALAKSPEQRYQSGAELAAALENYRVLDPAQVATAAAPVLTPDATATFVTRAGGAGVGHETKPPAQTSPQRRMPLYILAVALLVGISVLGWTLYHRRSTITPTSAPAAQGPAPPQPPLQGPVAQSAGQAKGPATDVSVFRGTSPNKNTARMTVNSSPPGAQILMDGAATGKTTPAILQLPRGEHTVALHLQGFQQSATKFKVRGGEEFEFAPTLSAAIPNVPELAIPNVDLGSIPALKNMNNIMMGAGLTRAEGELWREWGTRVQKGEPVIMVTTRPPGARILLDGKDTGKKSPGLISLSATGKYRVQVQLEGFRTEERNVDVQPHVPGQLYMTLQPTGTTEPQ
jgi:serine/threonine-protein kinase